MRLCEICKSIPLGNLPPFPKTATLVATPEAPQHHYRFVIDGEGGKDEPPSSLGFHYHQDRGGLWQSAAGGCGLCRLVENQARLVTADVKNTAAAAAAPDGRRAVPNFDLWVTARRGAGDGFWVLSGCGDDRPGKTVVLVAAVGFCVDKDDPLATVFRGRPVEEIPGETAFGLMRDWLAESADITQQSGRQSDAPGTLPPLLIDVGDAATDDVSTVAIVQPNPDGDTRYIALSYPRHDDDDGGSPMRQAAQSTTPDIAAGSALEISNLPQTFQDAVSLTRKLGLRHLWIDVLCAPGAQDHSSSSSSGNGGPSGHTAAAAAVYENAHLTVAATGSAAAGASDGLFVRRPRREYVSLSYPGGAAAASPSPSPPAPVPSGTVLAYPLPLRAEVEGLHGALASEPLWRCARARRERAVSRRVLHFAADQIFFEGPGADGGDARFVSEEGLVGPLWRPPSSSAMDTAASAGAGG